MIEIIFWVSLFFLVVAYGFYWIWAFHKGAPYYPSSKQAISDIVQELASEQKTLRIAELGSGDGRLAFGLAKTGAEIVAYEVNPLLTILTRVLKFLKRTTNLTIKNADFLQEDLSEFDVVVAYLYPEVMQKLEPKLFSELKDGSRIISNTFKIKTRTPNKVINDKIFVYDVSK